MRGRLWAVAVLVVGLAGGPAVAQPQYEYAWYNGSQDVTNGSVGVAAGVTSVTLNLYLRPTAVNGGTALTQFGLETTGVSLTYPNPANVKVADLNAISPNTGTGGFTDTFTYNATAYVDNTMNPPAQFSLAVDAAPGVASVKPPTNDNRVLLAAVTFTLGATPTGTVTAGDIPDPDQTTSYYDPNANNGMGDFVYLDGVIASSTVSFSPVPEPAGVLLVAGSLLAVGRAVRRRAAGGPAS